MLKSQKNKKKFIEPLKRLINENGKNGLIHIPKECITELERFKRIKKLPTIENNWYAVNYHCSTDIALLEVEPDYYKIVSGGKTGQFLRHYKWCYDGKNVYTCSIVTRKKVMLERVTLNYIRYGYFKNVDLDDAAHHMWFRFCALGGTLKSFDQKVHLENHNKIGNYDRGQSIEILTTTDFDYFISVVEEIYNLLQNRVFSIEF